MLAEEAEVANACTSEKKIGRTSVVNDGGGRVSIVISQQYT